jgi:hypothetical protein
MSKNEKLIKLKKYYKNKLEEYALLVNEIPEAILTDPKKEFRYFCYNYLNLIRQLKLPEIKLNQEKEAVLIEFRNFPHIEFLIRNMVDKLGENWSHTIVCGNQNYNNIQNIVSSISNQIKIINLGVDNMTVSSYSKLLTTSSFWNHFTGSKILIYQEDSCIFKYNINEFLKYDYIGAAWHPKHNYNSKNVGNGGFSLRTKQCMLDVIRTVPLDEIVLRRIYPLLPPEDIYFTKIMVDYNIGQVADFNIGMQFSSETFINKESLGGHAFFYTNPNWSEIMYDKIISRLL